MPQFPWPPPRWSSRAVLPAALVIARESEPLGPIFDRLREALRRADISEWSVFAVGGEGFAIVSRLENIDDDGRPTPTRWSIDRLSARPRSFSIPGYIAALFNASPGRYRVVAFVVTAWPVTASSSHATPATMENLLASGAGDLPYELRITPLPRSGRCEALVYEFFRPSEDDSPTQVTASRLSAIQHLAAAGLWHAEDLR
jgi:hypothetical protein